MAGEGGPPYISGSTVASLVSFEEVVEVLREGFVQISAREKGGVVQPVRTAVPVSDHGVLLSMPAYSQQSNCLGVKLIGIFPGNNAKGLSTHQGIILVFDVSTGCVLALVEAETLTSIRTAAASFCAIKALTPTPPAVLCVVGTGVEARSHLKACKELLGCREIRLWGRSRDKASKCVGDCGGGVVVYDKLEEAVQGADVVITVTMSREPVLLGKWLKEGAVVCCVGACRPDWRELDDDIMQNAVVTVDSRDAAKEESGDVILSKTDIYAEIGEVISGSKPLPKVPECGKKFYLFKSLGMAIEDALSGKLVYDKWYAMKPKL